MNRDRNDLKKEISKYLTSIKYVVSQDSDLAFTTRGTILELKERWLAYAKNDDNPFINQFFDLAKDEATFKSKTTGKDVVHFIQTIEEVLAKESRQKFVAGITKKHVFTAFVTFAALLALAVTFILLKPVPKDVWAIVYYEKSDISGKRFSPYFSKEIDFHWKDASPITASDLNSFSLVAYSCIEITEDNSNISFRLLSDDGSRIYVNGRSLGGSWKNQRETTVDLPTTLNKGLHMVELHYYDAGGHARLKASISINGSDLMNTNDEIFSLPAVRSSGQYFCSKNGSNN